MAEPRAKVSVPISPRLFIILLNRLSALNWRSLRNVDPDGDIILVIGLAEDIHDVSIQVSSKVLSVASKVFKAMFSRNFKGGNEMAAAKGNVHLQCDSSLVSSWPPLRNRL